MTWAVTPGHAGASATVENVVAAGARRVEADRGIDDREDLQLVYETLTTFGLRIAGTNFNNTFGLINRF